MVLSLSKCFGRSRWHSRREKPRRPTGTFCALAGLFLLNAPLVATEAGQGCAPFSSANDVLRCAVQRDKSLKVLETEVQIAEAGIEVGGQRLNPELEIESMKRERGFSHGITLTQSLDLAGKRDARQRVASAEKDAAAIALRKVRDDVVFRTVGSLYRLRQIQKELEIIREGISTFSQVARHFQRAGALSPEQRISISIFKMALEDHKIREATLLSEKQALVADLSLALGQTFVPDQKYLPPQKANWPTLKATSINSNGVAQAKTETAIARAGYELQKSEAWPDLTLGPKVEIDEDRKTWIGLSLSLPLPLFNQNQGGKSQALARVNRGEVLESKASDEAQRTHAYLLESYGDLSASIERTLKNGEVEAKHKDLHSMLNRGVVAAPLITELHRQREDYYSRLHEQELKTVETLWQIYALEGRADKEQL